MSNLNKLINQGQKIKKVIIPAAGKGTRFLPFTKIVAKEMLPVLTKPIMHHLITEVANSGIEEVIIVIAPHKLEILKYFTADSSLEQKLQSNKKIDFTYQVLETKKTLKIFFVIQEEQLGLGHAILVGSQFLNNEPFAVILGDDLITTDSIPAIKQLIDVYNKKQASVLGIQTVSPHEVHKYGIVEPKGIATQNLPTFEIKGALEKPNLNETKSRQAILGRYVFQPQILLILKELLSISQKQEVNVVDAFAKLLKTHKIYAYNIKGIRYDLGSLSGFVKAQIDYALNDSTISDVIKEHIKNLKLS